MKIAGIAKNSFVDYPGKIAAVIFAAGCNFDCWYCHNRALLAADSFLDIGEVSGFLRKRRNVLDAAVFSGGEACMQDGLADLMAEVKSMGYLIKLDTNGSFPRVIESLLQKGLPDFIAMDIKAPFAKYKSAACAAADTQALKESIRIIMESAPDYEFRTTCVPVLGTADIEEIAREIRGARAYALQQYRRGPENQKILAMRFKPHGKAFFEEARAVAQKYVRNVIIRGV